MYLFIFILPSLFALLTLNFDLPLTLSWFESKFPFYNGYFILNISHLPYQAFRHRFLNFECHNERYQSHFFNDFLGRAHCFHTCELCLEHDSTYYSSVDFELSCFKDSNSFTNNSKFKPFA